MKKNVKRLLIICCAVLCLLIILSCLYLVKFAAETGMMTSLETQQVIEGVYAIQDTFVNMFLVKGDDDTYIAIDAGSHPEHILLELQRLKIDPQHVVAVLLTHADTDHVAALELFKQATVYLSHDEEQMINGQTARFLFIKNHLKSSYKLLEDQQILNISGLQIKGILTPGHTPGSMCYLIDNIYLFTGDSMSLKDGAVFEFNKFFNMDSNMQQKSLRTLANLPGVNYIFTAHYGFTDKYEHAFENWRD